MFALIQQLASVGEIFKLRNESAAVRPIALSLLPSRKASALRPNISPTLKAPGLYSQGIRCCPGAHVLPAEAAIAAQ